MIGAVKLERLRGEQQVWMFCDAIDVCLARALVKSSVYIGIGLSCCAMMILM